MQVVLAYTSYLGADACYLSGICSVLFCAMVSLLTTGVLLMHYSCYTAVLLPRLYSCMICAALPRVDSVCV